MNQQLEKLINESMEKNLISYKLMLKIIALIDMNKKSPSKDSESLESRLYLSVLKREELNLIKELKLILKSKPDSINFIIEFIKQNPGTSKTIIRDAVKTIGISRNKFSLTFKELLPEIKAILNNNGEKLNIEVKSKNTISYNINKLK